MYENLFKSPLHRVFFYGTLKRGEPNHELIRDTANGYAKFLGIGKTVNKYPLIIATRFNIPFLLHKPGVGHQVLGEVYDVDSKMLEKMDQLEEHPTFYTRMEDDVLLAPDKPDFNFDQGISCATRAHIYFLPKFKSSLLEKPMYQSYSSEGTHGLKVNFVAPWPFVTSAVKRQGGAIEYLRKLINP
ncbi:putative gamma-glutamylcyclotransferase CG2811 [Cotesia typhae]|uniref:putative gamma-glutamylcyclotransferase CG2811 n=1 Tax=Cotesia typhae TaxID=2053667 RepID=UPI003D685AC2